MDSPECGDIHETLILEVFLFLLKDKYRVQLFLASSREQQTSKTLNITLSFEILYLGPEVLLCVCVCVSK